LHHMQPHALLHSAQCSTSAAPLPTSHFPTLLSMQTSHTEWCCVVESTKRESTDNYTLRDTRVGAQRSSCVSLNRAACQQPLSASYLRSPLAHARCPALRTRLRSLPSTATHACSHSVKRTACRHTFPAPSAPLLPTGNQRWAVLSRPSMGISNPELCPARREV